MDAHPRSLSELLFPHLGPDTFGAAGFDEEDCFPTDLAAETECRLMGLADTLFNELDSPSPDLRALEHYQAVCDELAIRGLDSGVA